MIFRKIIRVKAVFDGQAWKPDIPQVPKGMNWTLLDFSNNEMIIELFSSDNAILAPQERKTLGDMISEINKPAWQGKILEHLATHQKSPIIIFSIEKNGIKIEEG